MSSWSFTIDAPRSDREIANAVDQALRMDQRQVMVVDDLRAAPARLDPAVSVMCERASVSGDFTMQVVIHPLTDDVRDHLDRDDRGLLVTACHALDVNSLLEGDGPNPYEAILVPRDGAPQVVYLDADALDNDDALVLCRRPVTIR